ncbi:MAG: sulfurtransferase [Xanthomonadales bacterium]|nr:sulfurtransferase [Xanthomonadales bacterium]
MTEMLVTVDQLDKLLQQGACVLVDCRFDLSQPQKSLQEYLAGHIPSAAYAHLDEHLSSEIGPHSGRHPLPSPDRFAVFLASIAWNSEKLLVAYDAGNNTFSARLWWLMRYFGLRGALLDGGLEAWKQAGMPLQNGPVEAKPGTVPELTATLGRTVSAVDIMSSDEDLTMVDARAADRFSGSVEPLDSKAGHIPGALNRPMSLNLNADARFKKPQQLRAEFDQLLADREAGSVVHYCGSGVTACHNTFAMELAGFGLTRIYPGSWSEWIRDSSRPIETEL